MANIIGTDGNDTLFGTDSADTINGKAGNDNITGSNGDDTLRGGGGKDTFVYSSNDGTDTITDFGGVGKGTNPTAAVIAEVDTIKFLDEGSTARNLLLTQNGNNLEITFQDIQENLGFEDSRVYFSDPILKVILQNFKLEDLDNLKASGTRPAIGNILFDGQTSITNSFNVLDANSTDTTIGIKNTVTFLNDLNNNITGLDNSDDVINGQGGNDKIDGLSGNDLLRGGTGNDTLIGGIGNDTLVDDTGNNSLVGGIGDDILIVDSSTGYNTLNGGAGNDQLYARASEGNNLLFGGDGNDTLDSSYLNTEYGYSFIASSGNNTLYGGTGDDRLVVSPEGNNLLSGDDGNDYLSSSGYDEYRANYNFSSSGNNTLNGGTGNDTVRAEYSTGNNLLNGGDGNDYLSISGYYIQYDGFDDYDVTSGNNTLNGGTGNDTLRAEYSTGNNLLSGGDGNDSLYVSPSSPSTSPSYSITQTVDGGKGDDLLSIDYSNATGGITSTFNATTNIGSITAGTYRVNYKNIERLNISGTAYNDNIVGSNGNDTLSSRGNGGNDTIDGGKGDDLLSIDYSNATGGITSTFNATTNIGSITAGTYRVNYKNIERLNISGTAYNDNIVGSNGNDTLSSRGNGGNDTIDGGKGDDLLSIDYSNATGGITSTFNATTNIGSITAGTYRVNYKNIERLNISGTLYNDKIVGSSGNDTLSTGYGGNDTIDGGKGNDYLTISYSSDNNLLSGGDGNDTLSAFTALGNNTLNGGNGNDYLTGGNGNDSLIGGAGVDTFAFNSFNEGLDTIYDFNATNEVIQISAANFGGGLSIGSLKANQFTIGTSATTSTQRFIYNSTTGALFFDQDGSAGAFTKVQFAQLSTGLSLTNNSFVVV
ncbi:calcium-binding protein [Nostoc sp. NMS8]|uniref:beta strand repeat-containing protein n=3 Tax=Nostoc TaxID=1177 RepID=UPI0025E96EF1|nr:calcium-binding protein [Nostoc sp. NMS8]MBN3957465.1 calcium-binding protein [Nostoc sp. NMS8]